MTAYLLNWLAGRSASKKIPVHRWTFTFYVRKRKRRFLQTAGGGDGMLPSRLNSRALCAAAAWGCWARSLQTTSPSLNTFSNLWRPVLRQIARFECCAVTVWATRLCSSSIVPPSSRVWRTPPAHGAVSQRPPIASASTHWLTAPKALDTARRTYRRLMNCVILQTMSYSATSFYGRTMYCTHYYHFYPPCHNATTSDTELTPDSCPYTQHTYPTVTFLHACYIRTHIRIFFHNTRIFIHSLLHTRTDLTFYFHANLHFTLHIPLVTIAFCQLS